MITRQLQQAANDLAAVEQALLMIRSCLPALPPLRADAPGTRHMAWKAGDCTEVSRAGHRCRGPATCPYGLCPTHFLRLFGHHFSLRREGGRCACSVVKKRHGETKQQTREFCVMNGQSARALQILREHSRQVMRA